jgi:putative ABC transport system substrate-binding protein
MQRREFLTLFGGAAATWPFATHAESRTPVIGFMSTNAGPEHSPIVAGLREGLKETGFVEGRNVAVEFRWADGHYDQFPAMAADLVSRHVNVIVANGPAVFAAKAATTSIPIVFLIGDDPVRFGLVSSLARPDGNLTGIGNLNVQLGPKRLELIHDLLPQATDIAVLINPANPRAEGQWNDFQAAARTIGRKVHLLHASSEQEFQEAFAKLTGLRTRALVIGADPFFNSRSQKLAALALRYKIAAIYQYRPFALAGGLMSYGPTADFYRVVGVYAGRILQGAKPADLPVQQSTTIELVINLKTAQALALTVPPTLRALANEVVE